jgi:glycosyltransferase involved in cell wall biosynthesis
MNPAPPLVSLVMPSFNQAQFLDEALASVVSQDYTELEVIVMDGGSTDGSVEIIRRYEDRLASWTSEPDRGQVDALTRGFARAKGDVLGWLNSDDVLLPGAITATVDALTADRSLLIAYGDNVLIDHEGHELGPLPSRPFDVNVMLRTVQNHVPQPGSLFRRAALDAAGGLPASGYYYFDFELVVRFGLAGRAAKLDRSLAKYRLHDESKSISAKREKAVDLLRMYDAIFALPELPAEFRAIEREARSSALLSAGEYFYAALDQRDARRAVLGGLRAFPRHITPRTIGLLARSLLPASIVPALRRFREA